MGSLSRRLMVALWMEREGNGFDSVHLARRFKDWRDAKRTVVG